MTRTIPLIAALLLAVACERMPNEAIIRETKACEAAGMEAQPITRDGVIADIQCAPIARAQTVAQKPLTAEATPPQKFTPNPSDQGAGFRFFICTGPSGMSPETNPRCTPTVPNAGPMHSADLNMDHGICWLASEPAVRWPARHKGADFDCRIEDRKK